MDSMWVISLPNYESLVGPFKTKEDAETYVRRCTADPYDFRFLSNGKLVRIQRVPPLHGYLQ